MSIETIPDEALEYLISHGEFPDSIIKAAPHTVVVMTQDWCPQWHEMLTWLPEFTETTKVWLIVYNTHPAFARIMGFKEDTFKNREVPYIRAYYQGDLMGTGNWMPRRTFAALIERTTPLRMP